MRTEANRKIVTLPDGMKFKPVFSKCPKCGCDLQKWHDALVHQIGTKQAKNGACNAEGALKASTKKSLAHGFLNDCVAWMIFPFAAAKKYATKRDQKR
ncbi:hypothetical protein AWS18_04965 [Enterobacter hormaechei subsp. oharae]|nr:hypothetical protein AWS18_04965 [Enterobacter hormaechei subsp. oharae]